MGRCLAAPLHSLEHHLRPYLFHPYRSSDLFLVVLLHSPELHPRPYRGLGRLLHSDYPQVFLGLATTPSPHNPVPRLHLYLLHHPHCSGWCLAAPLHSLEHHLRPYLFHPSHSSDLFLVVLLHSLELHPRPYRGLHPLDRLDHPLASPDSATIPPPRNLVHHRHPCLPHHPDRLGRCLAAPLHSLEHHLRPYLFHPYRSSDLFLVVLLHSPELHPRPYPDLLLLLNSDYPQVSPDSATIPSPHNPVHRRHPYP